MTTRCMLMWLFLSVAANGCGDDDDGGDESERTAGSGGTIETGGTGGRAGTGGSGGAGGTGGATGNAGMEGAREGGDSARRIVIVATEFEFTPDRIEASAGEMLIIELRNEGDDFHNVTFGLEEEHELDDDLPPDETAELMIPIPGDLGDYDFWCPVANHRQLGMDGTLVVE